MRGAVMRGEILGLERRRFWSDEDKLRIVTSVGTGSDAVGTTPRDYVATDL